MRINVTQRDINKGAKGGCMTCPIARAIGRHFPRWRHLRVGGDRVMVSPLDGGELRGLLPSVATYFIIKFDHGKKVKPFTFELNLFAA